MTYSSNDGHCHDSHSQARWNEIDTYSTLTLASGARTQCPSPSQVLDGRQPETILVVVGPVLCGQSRWLSRLHRLALGVRPSREGTFCTDTAPGSPGGRLRTMRSLPLVLHAPRFCLYFFCCAVLSRFFLSSVPSPTKLNHQFESSVIVNGHTLLRLSTVPPSACKTAPLSDDNSAVAPEAIGSIIKIYMARSNKL
jgi:hypothetical protein